MVFFFLKKSSSEPLCGAGGESSLAFTSLFGLACHESPFSRPPPSPRVETHFPLPKRIMPPLQWHSAWHPHNRSKPVPPCVGVCGRRAYVWSIIECGMH